MAYARIEEGFWTDPKIRSLPLEGKMVAAWLFTNPHRHFSGLYYLPIVLIPHEIGLSIGVSEKMFNVLEEQGFLRYSNEFSVVWVVNMLKHQSAGKPLSTQQITGIANHLRTLHGCPLITDFVNKYKRLGVKFDGEINTPIDTPIDIKSQSQSQSKSQSKYKDMPISSATPTLKKSSSKNGKKAKTPLPENFGISEGVKAWAIENHFNHLDKHLEAFKRKATMNGYVYVNWDMAFMEAIREDWAKIRVKGYASQEEPQWTRELSKQPSTN